MLASPHPQVPSRDAGRGRRLKASSISQLGRGEAMNHAGIHMTGISSSNR